MPGFIRPQVDQEIEKTISDLLKDLTSITTEENEKDLILNRIYTLRQSMNPPCNCSNKD